MSDLDIQIIEPKYDNERYKFLSDQAIQSYMYRRTKASHKQMLDVIAGLCRQAYLKGRHDMKKEMSQ